MRKIIVLMVAAIILGGCGETTKEAIQTRQGTIMSKVGDEYILKTTEDMVNITSTKINLDNYLKKEVEVKGQFSGSTLYVDEIK